MKEQAETLRENVEHWHKQFVRANARAEAAEERVRLQGDEIKYQADQIRALQNQIVDLKHRLAKEAGVRA